MTVRSSLVPAYVKVRVRYVRMVALEAVESVVAYDRRAETPLTVRTLWAARDVKNVRHASR